MNKRHLLAIVLTLFVTNAIAEPVPPARNKDGSLVSGFLTADFELRSDVGLAVPLPTNFLFDQENPDLTLGFPVDPSDPAAPVFAALNSVDGWSTTERWITTFTAFPNKLDPSSVVPGQSVRMFEVTIEFGTVVIVDGVVRELTPGVDYVATMLTDDTLAIVPLKPLKEVTTYMAVLTNDINDTVGNDATASQFYSLTKSLVPWVDENGNSTNPVFDDETAATLEGVRRITLSMENAAVSQGIPREDIVIAWTAQTQSVTPVLKNIRGIARPAANQVVNTGMNTSILGAPGIADIYMGIITLPYYLGVSSASNPTPALTDYWTAAPGGYVPPFDALGLDPNSTNVTLANPFPPNRSQRHWRDDQFE